MRYKVLTAVKLSVLVFWVITVCGLVDAKVSEEHWSILWAEDGGSMFLHIISVYLSNVFQMSLFKPQHKK
jgi:hypothetical protein